MKLYNGIVIGFVVVAFGLVAPAGLAGTAGDTTERSGGDTVQRPQSSPGAREGGDRPSASDTERPVFTSTSASSDGGNRFSNPQLRTYNPRVNRLRPVDDPRERFPQPDSPHERPIVWVDKSEDSSASGETSGSNGDDQRLDSLLERDEIRVDQPTRERADDGNLIVFCNRKLLEMHIRRDCEMLGDVTPTPVPLRSAREARYAPCTVCYKPR